MQSYDIASLPLPVHVCEAIEEGSVLVESTFTQPRGFSVAVDTPGDVEVTGNPLDVLAASGRSLLLPADAIVTLFANTDGVTPLSMEFRTVNLLSVTVVFEQYDGTDVTIEEVMEIKV